MTEMASNGLYVTFRVKEEGRNLEKFFVGRYHAVTFILCHLERRSLILVVVVVCDENID